MRVTDARPTDPAQRSMPADFDAHASLKARARIAPPRYARTLECCNTVPIVTSMEIVCKNPDCPPEGEPFTPKRAGAQYCSGACRTAAYRKRHMPLPAVEWTAKTPSLGKMSRSYNSDGTLALSSADLGERLIEIAARGDDGAPKTGRRYFYHARHQHDCGDDWVESAFHMGRPSQG